MWLYLSTIYWQTSHCLSRKFVTLWLSHGTWQKHLLCRQRKYGAEVEELFAKAVNYERQLDVRSAIRCYEVILPSFNTIDLFLVFENNLLDNQIVSLWPKYFAILQTFCYINIKKWSVSDPLNPSRPVCLSSEMNLWWLRSHCNDFEEKWAIFVQKTHQAEASLFSFKPAALIIDGLFERLLRHIKR